MVVDLQWTLFSECVVFQNPSAADLHEIPFNQQPLKNDSLTEYHVMRASDPACPLYVTESAALIHNRS